MAIWREIGRFADWRIFFAFPAGRLIRPRGMAATNLRSSSGDRHYDAMLVGKRIRERLANDNEEPKLSVSIGMAVYPEDGATIDSLFKSADRALYAMKQQKKAS